MSIATVFGDVLLVWASTHADVFAGTVSGNHGCNYVADRGRDNKVVGRGRQTTRSMRYLALASDYDETLAADCAVSPATLDAVERLRHSGRKLVLVTGRQLSDLEKVFPHLHLADRIVAENGAVLYDPATREKRVLTDPPKPAFVQALRGRGVQPLAIGDCIVATCYPHENTVLQAIRDLGLELQVIFNKGSVMILPSGVNKMSGLKAALDDLGLSEHNVVGVGDAENDHAFLSYCGFAAAVANALPAVKDTADLTTRADHGAGVVELIDMILEDDLASQDWKRNRRMIPVGYDHGSEVSIRARGSSILISGVSASENSTAAAALLDSLMTRKFQVCIIDPEGDYESFPGTISLGTEKAAPSADQILQAFKKPRAQVVANLAAIPDSRRQDFVAGLLPRLQEMRLRIGRPHWLMIDEAHQALPSGALDLTGEFKNMILITAHPDRLAPAALNAVDIVFGVGSAAKDVITCFARAIGVAPPRTESGNLVPGEASVWFRDSGEVRRVEMLVPNKSSA